MHQMKIQVANGKQNMKCLNVFCCTDFLLYGGKGARIYKGLIPALGCLLLTMDLNQKW